MSLHSLSLLPYGIRRPEKVRWRFPSVAEEQVLEHIQSKSLRKFLRRADELLLHHGITWSLAPLTKSAFLEWLKYYQAKMTEREYDIIASEEWFDKRTEQGFQIEGMFFTTAAHERIGTGILTWHPEQRKGTFAFKASERIDLTNDSNSSLGAVLDYFFIREMTRRGAVVLSAGQSRNAFGVINSLGYLDYKLRLGYLPSFAEESTILDDVPLDDQGRVLCYGNQAGVTKLFAFKPVGDSTLFEQSRFGTADLPYEEIEYSREK